MLEEIIWPISLIVTFELEKQLIILKFQTVDNETTNILLLIWHRY